MGAGIPPIVGAIAMCAIRCIPDGQEEGAVSSISFSQHIYISELQDAEGKLLTVSETKETIVENA